MWRFIREQICYHPFYLRFNSHQHPALFSLFQLSCLSHSYGTRYKKPRLCGRCYTSMGPSRTCRQGQIPTDNIVNLACPASLPARLSRYNREDTGDSSASPEVFRWMVSGGRLARKPRSTSSVLWSFNIYSEAQFWLVRPNNNFSFQPLKLNKFNTGRTLQKPM